MCVGSVEVFGLVCETVSASPAVSKGSVVVSLSSNFSPFSAGVKAACLSNPRGASGSIFKFTGEILNTEGLR